MPRALPGGLRCGAIVGVFVAAIVLRATHAWGGPPSSPAATPASSGSDATGAPRNGSPATGSPEAGSGLREPGTTSSPPRAPRESPWELESVKLQDGQVLEGLILTDRPDAFEFVEIRRPPGRPMQMVLRVPQPGSVVERHRLEGPRRQVLWERYQGFKHRVRIELGRMEQVTLDDEERDGVGFLTYQGRWFHLSSTADPEMTRRCVVRVEQIVRAYRQLLPSRADSPPPFRLILYGSMDEYRGHLQRLGLELDNPAFYSAPQNLIVAGSNLSRYSERLRQIRDENVAILRQYDQVLNPRFDQSLLDLGRQIKRQGGNLEEVALRRAAWDWQYKALLRRIDETNRRNEAKFAEVTRQMFSRLYHESFHAYLENCVYPHGEHDVPRWLNEGLAQVFESGQLEADTLRIDAPSRERLQQLRAALQRDPRPLTRLLASESLSRGATGHVDYSMQDYLYAWGLAHFLTFEFDLLGQPAVNGQPALDWYVSPEAARMDPIARFEKLVRQRLGPFEARWRTAMLDAANPTGGTP